MRQVGGGTPIPRDFQQVGTKFYRAQCAVCETAEAVQVLTVARRDTMDYGL